MSVDTSGNVTASGNVTTTGNTAVGGTLAVTGVHTVGNNAIHTSDGGAVTQNLVQGLAKHWIQINGEGTVAIQDSFNNSSVADNGTGYYSFNINNDMANDDYCALETTNRISGGSGVLMHHHIGGTGTGVYTVYNSNSSDTLTDTSQIFGLAFGDLA
jgi:hypothetical protein